ncbi:hypothetical protein Pint_30803 [Pistacia integerrima]|uniref:Uncharacterized protein n=1 Tax=Pistacia integerrima TaxID=434235 RepID=A0ACC0WZ75_9ROSI|nr:hypothetical protein Pint_30803 [Pistacia integerrima]
MVHIECWRRSVLLLIGLSSLEARIHPVFHVSCLKKKLGERHQPLVTLPPIDKDGIIRQEPEEILHKRLKKKKNHVVTEVLVKWKGLGEEEASWVEYSTLVNKFPNLVDKVFFLGGSMSCARGA